MPKGWWKSLYLQVLAAIFVMRYGTLPWSVALVIGVGLFVAYRMLGVLSSLPSKDLSMEVTAIGVVFSALICLVLLVPTLICSAIVRALFGLAPAHMAKAG